MTPGKITAVPVELNATGSILQAGSILELIIMAPNMAPEPLGQWGFLPLPMSRNRVHFSAAHPSHIVMAEFP
jgi:hypothetical protein